jgi:hypothetical protein
MPLVELKSKYRKVSSVDKVGKGWQEEYDASSKQVILSSIISLNIDCNTYLNYPKNLLAM